MPPLIPVRWGTRDGFTLIEVIVALAILGGGMLILLESHYASLRLFEEAQDAALSSGLFESAAAVAEQEVLSGETSGEGDFGKRFVDYAYTFDAEQLDETNAPGLFEVRVTLHGPLEDREMVFYAYDGHQLTEGGDDTGSGGLGTPRAPGTRGSTGGTTGSATPRSGGRSNGN